MRTMKHWALAAAAAAALALAGCGGGGSSSSAPPAGPTAAEMLAERQMEQRNAISTAITMAETAVAGVNDDSTDSEVSAADMAVTAARTAITNAADLPPEETAANTGTVDAIANRLTAAKSSRTAALDEADKANRAAMAKTGKALHAALGPNQGGTSPLTNIATPTLSSAGLAINAAAGAGALPDATDPDSVTLKAGDSAGALGSWMGTDYALTTGTGASKVTNEARVYNNKGPGKTVSLAAAGITVHTAATAGDDIKGYYTVDETADLAKIMGAAFTHSGTQNHAYDSDNEVAFTTRGTFDGAPGEYRCTGTCSSTNDGTGSPSALAGVWHFKPDAGAMVHQPDTTYLYYGWWVSKDSDGGPTAASAFTGVVFPTTGSAPTGVGGATINGSATYAGHAAGKFAMSNVLDGTGNGGHFTADAELKATFGSGTTAGMTGTIDNFRLNDGSEDPGWSVALARGAWGADGAITAPTADPTVWSINGNKAPASGTWSGQMYDEMPGNAPDGDGSDVPTTVTGTFYSEFSTIGRMAGAFGAEKQ